MPPKLESDDSVKASQRCAAVFLEFILEQKEQNISEAVVKPLQENGTHKNAWYVDFW